jgi:hypothetical protein
MEPREDGPPWMESNEKLGYLRMESEKMLAYPRWKLPCSHLHALISLGYYPQMEPTEKMGYPGWN